MSEVANFGFEGEGSHFYKLRTPYKTPLHCEQSARSTTNDVNDITGIHSRQLQPKSAQTYFLTCYLLPVTCYLLPET